MSDDGVREAWAAATKLWGVRLHEPVVQNGAGEQVGSFAWFTFPPEVTIDLAKATADGAADHLVSVFAHEIGHHVLAPGTRINDLKLKHQIARGLAAGRLNPRQIGRVVPLLANIWSDLLINERVVRMQRREGPPDMIELWRALQSRGGDDPLFWWLIMRAYEIRWSLPPGTYCAQTPPPLPATAIAADATPQADSPSNRKLTEEQQAQQAAQAEVAQLSAQLAEISAAEPVVDARLLADLVGTYAADPVEGSLPFAVLIAPYVYAELRSGDQALGAVLDGRKPGDGTAAGDEEGTDEGVPGVAGVCGGNHDGRPPTAAELEEILGDRRMTEAPWHPARGKEPEPTGEAMRAGPGASELETTGQGYGLADTLALYASADSNAVMSAWYQAQARPYIRPLDHQTAASDVTESIPGPTGTWQLGDDIGDIDWTSTLVRSTTVVPGVTTQSRSFLPDDPASGRLPIELDLYIDSSGSMCQPEHESPAILAGTILALSVLRAGGRVRVTSFASPGQVAGTPDFSRHRGEVMAALLTFFRGGTTFPLDLLDKRYRRRSADRDVHLIVLSDDGLASMFGVGQPEYADVAARVRPKLADAALILIGVSESVDDAAEAAGYRVDHVNTAGEVPRLCAQLADRITGVRDGMRAGAAHGFR